MATSGRGASRSAFGAALAVLICIGASAQQEAGASARLPVYDRWRAEFSEAWFLKPAEARPEDLTLTLAPLLLLESPARTNGAASRLPPGNHLGIAGSEKMPDRAVLYVYPDSTEIRGRRHTRVAYVWFQNLASPAHATAGVQTQAQGVRITLNAANEPAIWEVLKDSSGSRLLYVSEKMEAAAATEFGLPLEHRCFSVEASASQAPDTIVARVLDDGPVSMGPMAYVSRRTGDMMTLACRCMNSQAKKLAGMGTYELQPWALAFPKPTGAAFWPGEAEKQSLEKHLRIPSAF